MDNEIKIKWAYYIMNVLFNHESIESLTDWSTGNIIDLINMSKPVYTMYIFMVWHYWYYFPVLFNVS